jgi:site-specific recombinase XerD
MRPLAPTTVRQYQSILARVFGPGINTVANPDALPSTQTALAAILATAPALSNTQRVQLRAALRRFYTGFGQSDMGESLSNAVLLKYDIQRIRPRPSLEDADKFEAAIAQGARPNQRTLLYIMLRTGMRAEELLALTRLAVQAGVNTGTLTFVRKGGAEAQLPVTPALKKHFTKLLKASVDFDEASGGVIQWERVSDLLTLRPGRTAHRALLRVVKNVARAAGLDASLWFPHQLRHVFATRLHAAGASVFVIRQALNHRNITTTQRYVDLGADDLATYMEKV